MRERLTFSALAEFMRRITPARAGKTIRKPLTMSKKWDHPRPYGKDLLVRLIQFVKAGSPPPVRERLGSDPAARDAYRITPARAGKTHPKGYPVHHIQDHPRPCGKDIV